MQIRINLDALAERALACLIADEQRRAVSKIAIDRLLHQFDGRSCLLQLEQIHVRDLWTPCTGLDSGNEVLTVLEGLELSPAVLPR